MTTSINQHKLATPTTLFQHGRTSGKTPYIYIPIHYNTCTNRQPGRTLTTTHAQPDNITAFPTWPPPPTTNPTTPGGHQATTRPPPGRRRTANGEPTGHASANQRTYNPTLGWTTTTWPTDNYRMVTPVSYTHLDVYKRQI